MWILAGHLRLLVLEVRILEAQHNESQLDNIPNIFSQRHDQIGVLNCLPMLHMGSTGQAVHCGSPVQRSSSILTRLPVNPKNSLGFTQPYCPGGSRYPDCYDGLV